MIELERLIMLALDELDEPDASVVEEHVLACAQCSATLERLLRLGPELSEMVRRGEGTFGASNALLEALDSARMISRSYRLEVDRPVPCSVTADDIYALTTLEADLTGVDRVDLAITSPAGSIELRDIPFDVARGTVSYVTSSALLRQLPTGRVALELRASGSGGERRIGPYFLDHTAFMRSPSSGGG